MKLVRLSGRPKSKDPQLPFGHHKGTPSGMISGAAGDLTGIRELGELSHWGLRSVHHEFFSISPQMGLQDLSTMSKKEQTAIVISGEAIADDSVAELGLREVRRESCGLTQGSCGAAVWVKLDEYPV